MGHSKLATTSKLSISMRRSTIASISSILFVSTVNQLLFRIVTEDIGQLLEAGLNGGNCCKRYTGSTLKLVLHRGNQTLTF